MEDLGSPVRRWGGRAAVAVAVVVWLCSASVARAAPNDPAQDALTQLAERYAPVVFLQHQREPCGEGEPFEPQSVEQILGQRDVQLLDRSGKVLKEAPTSSDLAGAPSGSNINLPGDAGAPGCDYDKRFGRRTTTLPATQYVHLAVDPDRPGRFAIQYWWWYTYNDWNDLHEGDWEMGQIVFDAATPDVALAASTAPASMALSQHNSNEDRPWSRVSKDGDRPVVYVAAGSHANYYSSDLWLGTNGQTGFGCDDTRGPSDRVDPQVVVLPQADTADNGFGWLKFKGYWGQRQLATNDSETGPQTSQQWLHPIIWMEKSGRSAALQAPKAGILTSAYCTIASGSSTVLNTTLDKPWLLIAVVAMATLLVVFTATRTTWRPAVADPILRERAGGQILRSAWKQLRAEPRRYLPIAGLVLAASIVTAVIQSLLISLTPLSRAIAVAGQASPVGHVLAVLAGWVVTVPVGVIAIAWAVNVTAHASLDEERQRPARAKWRTGLLVSTGLLLATVVVGWVVLPIALVLVARWFVAPAAAAIRGAGPRDALRESAHLTRGYRIRTLAIAVVAVTLLVVGSGLLGTILVLIVGDSFAFVNVVAGVVAAVLLPWIGIVIVMTFGDLQARHAQA